MRGDKDYSNTECRYINEVSRALDALDEGYIDNEECLRRLNYAHSDFRETFPRHDLSNLPAMVS